MLAHLVLAWVSAALPAAPADSALSAAAPFHFERDVDYGRLSLVVDGASCADAKVTLRLAWGVEPYTLELPWSQITEGECSTEAAQKLLAEATLDFRAISLPRFPTREEARARGLEILLPEARYRELRDTRAAVLRFPVAPGKVRWVAFPASPALGEVAKGILVLDQNVESLGKTSRERFCGKPSRFCFADETKLAFTSREATDRIRVSVLADSWVQSDSCNDLRALVVVSNAEGRELLRREVPLDLPGTECSALAVANAIETFLNDASVESARSLFELYPYDDDETKTEMYSLRVSRETYERIRAADTEVLMFKVEDEGGGLDYLAWDPVAKKVVVVFSAGC